ncbi:MAG: AraC family transcriptional regulator [Eubacterium sp.]|nr:AraC family transcriptional regulator [Eubacterium sp.]MCM1213859.1 AraC family transcriptional regulator [Lachnospiraceae bacterium]MCM1240120.1 AraC family transcriptional regulator [Lachnospiraceae bacterium]
MKKLVRNSISTFLLSYIMVLVVPLMITTIGFQIAFNLVEENLKVTHINMLQRSADIIENELVDVESVALQIASDNTILEMVSKSRGDSNYILPMMDALENFTLYLNYKDIDLLDSDKAYIYLKNTDLVLYEKSYYKPAIFRVYLKNWGIDYDEWREEMAQADALKTNFRRNGDGFEYVFPFSRQMFGQKEGVIVLRIDGDVIARKMEFINSLESREMYMVEILDETGEQLWASHSEEEFPELTFEDLENSYLEKDGMSIIVAKSDKVDLYYVLVLPVKESLSQLAALKNIVLLLMLAATAAGVILALIEAVNKGKPVDEALQALTPEGEKPERYTHLGTAVSEIVKKHENVLQEIEQNKITLKKHFFDELLKAEFSTEAQLRSSAAKVGVDIDNQFYQTAFIQLFAENDFTTVDEQTMNEIRVLSQLMKNHLREICGDNNVWFHKKNFNSEIAIFAIDNMEEDVFDIIRQTKEWVMGECHIEITSGIGGTCNNLLLIWRSMEEARIALENCTREKPVVSYRAELIKSDEYYFPAIAEDKLEESIRSGQWQETKDILSLLETENCVNRKLRRNQFIKLNQKFMEILGRACSREELQEKAFWINEVLMQPDISGQEYFYRLRQLYRKVCNDNVEKKQEQKSRMVEEIKDYIRAHYCESDMGLTRVGSEFRVSESYLSTLFKEQSGRNFGDFLETLRIEKACELLQDRTITVNEVAEKVGYNSVQSFRRAFKRVKGVSPKEQREKNI